MQLFKNNSNQVVELIEEIPSPEGMVSIANAGGGFVRQVARDAFDQEFTPYEYPTDYQLVLVSLDGDASVYPGYSNGRRWNGWAMPVFELEAATQICAFAGGKFDVTSEIFDLTMHGEEEPYLVAPELIMVDGKLIKVWAIGTGCWTWSEEEQQIPKVNTLLEDAEWVLSYLQGIEAGGKHSPTQTMSRIVDELKKHYNADVESSLSVSIDGGITYIPAPSVRVIASDVGQSNVAEDLHINITTEGIILDVIGQDSDEVSKTNCVLMEDLVAMTQ